MAKRANRASHKPKRLTHIEFDYIKSNQFRVITMDGAFGGLSPTGKVIHMALFNERRPIPKRTVHPLNEGDVLGKEDVSRRDTRKAFIREVEVDVALDLHAAINLQTWLTDKIQQLAKRQGIELIISDKEKTEAKLKAPRKTNGAKRVHNA
jgi:hypothetical protein